MSDLTGKGLGVMGTQWVARGREAGRDDFGPRLAYRPRHAKRKGHNPRTLYRLDPMPALAPGQGPAAQFEPPVRGSDAEAPGSVGQVIADGGAAFGPDGSGSNGDEQWPAPGSA